MRALVRHRYGSADVADVEEVDKPRLEDDRVLVRVRADSINKADIHNLHGFAPLIRAVTGGGAFRPKTPTFGTDFAGVVEAVGKDVTGLAPGDEVLGGRDGAFAEYVAAKTLVRKPANATFEQASTLGIAGLTALQGLRDKGGLERGERVLVNGASGGVGTMAIQIAKALGGEVTAVVGTRNVEQARALGADHVIDRLKENFTRSGERYDLILDVAGGHSWRALTGALAPNGRVVLVGAHGNRRMLLHLAALKLASIPSKHKLTFFVAKFGNPDLQTLADMLGRGELTPAIDATYELADGAEALRVFEQGHVRGKLVLTI